MHSFCITDKEMRLWLTRSANLASLSDGGDSKQTRQEVPECPDGDHHDKDQDKKFLSEANKQKEEEKAAMASLVSCTQAAPSPPPTIIQEMEVIFLRLGFSQTVAMKLVDDQGINSPWTLASLSDEDIATIFDVICRSS